MLEVPPSHPLELLRYYNTRLEATRDSALKVQIQRELYHLYIEQRDYERAYEVGRAIPGWDTLFGMVRVLLSLGRYEEVLKGDFPPLSKGYAAEKLGRYEEAIGYYERSPEVVSGYTRLGMARCFILLGDLKRGEAILKGLPENPEVQELKVKVLEAEERWEELRRYVEPLPSSPRRLAWLASCARGLGGDPDRYRWELIRQYPGSKEARGLVLGLIPSTPEECYWLARVYEGVEISRAVEYYKRYLREEPKGGYVEEARYRLGRIWFRQGRLGLADSILKRCRGSKGRYLWARVAERADEPKEARRRFREFATSFPESELIDEALRMIGLSYEAEGMFDSAVTIYEELAQRFPEGRRRVATRAGVLRLIQGDAKAVDRLLRGIESPEADWLRVRAAMMLDDSGRVDSLTSRLALQHPYSYWTVELIDSIPVLEVESEEWIGDTLVELSSRDSVRYERVVTLLESGLLKEASSELSGIKAENPYLLYRLSRLCAQYGLDARSIEYAERLRQKMGRRVLPRWLLKLLYPVRYLSQMEGLAEDIPLVLAVIRQESWFNPEAVSRAGARGLMQLMPATARELGGDSLEWTRPEINIRLGIEYLSRMEERFGSKPLGLAAYNGGPGNLSRWLSRYPVEEGKFVLLIPFQETNHYVQATMVGRRIYQRLLE